MDNGTVEVTQTLSSKINNLMPSIWTIVIALSLLFIIFSIVKKNKKMIFISLIVMIIAIIACLTLNVFVVPMQVL